MNDGVFKTWRGYVDVLYRFTYPGIPQGYLQLSLVRVTKVILRNIQQSLCTEWCSNLAYFRTWHCRYLDSTLMVQLPVSRHVLWKLGVTLLNHPWPLRNIFSKRCTEYLQKYLYILRMKKDIILEILHWKMICYEQISRLTSEKFYIILI